MKDSTPRYWDLRVLAAHHHINGDTQEVIGKKVSRSRKTVNNWMQHESWPAVLNEARDRWHQSTEFSARRTFAKAVDRNPNLAWEYLQRVDEKLAPRSKHEHSGPKGGPIEHAASVTIYVPDNGRGDS